MKEKGNKGLIIIIIILVVALLAGGTFAAYDKGLIFNKKDNSKKRNFRSLNYFINKCIDVLFYILFWKFNCRINSKFLHKSYK